MAKSAAERAAEVDEPTTPREEPPAADRTHRRESTLLDTDAEDVIQDFIARDATDLTSLDSRELAAVQKAVNLLYDVYCASVKTTGTLTTAINNLKATVREKSIVIESLTNTIEQNARARSETLATDNKA
jgi:hypothetical protein